MAQGRNMRLLVGTTSVKNDADEIEMQGDLVINKGRTTQVTTYKNGQNASQSDAGFSIQITIGLTAPLSVTQDLLMDLNDSGNSAWFWIINDRTGGVEYAFVGIVAQTNENAPVNGDVTAQFQIAAQGAVTRSVKV